MPMIVMPPGAKRGLGVPSRRSRAKLDPAPSMKTPALAAAPHVVSSPPLAPWMTKRPSPAMPNERSGTPVTVRRVVRIASPATGGAVTGDRRAASGAERHRAREPLRERAVRVGERDLRAARCAVAGVEVAAGGELEHTGAAVPVAADVVDVAGADDCPLRGRRQAGDPGLEAWFASQKRISVFPFVPKL